MSNFIQAFHFIWHNGKIAGIGAQPTLITLTLETLKVAAIGLAVSLGVGLPIGVWLGHIHRFSFLAINLGNIWRALPSLAVLAIGVAFLGVGLTDVEAALIVLAIPPIITNAYVAVDGVDRDIVDAARGMGLTEGQIVRQVELPMGLPLIFAGIRTSALFIVSTTTIASLAGYPGTLGDIVNNEASYKLSGVLGSAYCIAALALLVEALLAGAQRALTPRGLKLADAAIADPAAAIAPLVGDTASATA